MNENQNEYVDINAHDNYPDSEQKIEIPTMKVIPLKKICMTIGELPTSYLETMTYYEMLIWFIEYLKNNIIPTINNNASAIQEVQSVVLALQNYINDYKDSIDEDVEELEEYMNNYFENLDVQEEINNKLDDMLEDGVLEQIIEQFIQSTAIWCFDNVADMKLATNLVNGSYARTLGYYSTNDGGGATYKITSTQSQTEHQELLNNGLFANLIIEDFINIKQVGATNNQDITSLLTNILDNYNKIFIPNGTYKLDNIELSNNVYIKNEGTINSLLGNTIFTLNNVSNITIEGGTYYGDNETTSQSLIRLIDSNNCVIKNMTLSNALNKGIAVGGTSSYNTIENINVSGAASSTGVGISLLGANVKYNTVKNIYTTGNRIGLSLNGCSYNNVNNIKSYNDNLMGVTVDGIITGTGDGGTYNNFNNIIIEGITTNTYAGLYLGNGSSYNNFSNVNITNCNAVGLKLTFGENELNGIGNNFTNVIIKNCTTGIGWSGAKYSTLSNFTIKEITGRGIYLGRSDNCCINNGVIDSCTTEGIFIQSGYTNLNNIKVKNNNEGIEIAFGLTSPTNNNISNIDFENNTIKDFIGAGTYIINNCTGYVVSNFGKISKANSQNIPHGLSNTPIYVNAVSSNANHNVSIINITETYFTISLTDNEGNAITTAEDIYWEARCK